MNRKSMLGLLVLVLAFAAFGIWQNAREESGHGVGPDTPGAAAASSEGPKGILQTLRQAVSAAASGVSFQRWKHPQGLFSTEVPAGWRIEGQIEPKGLDKGAFMIQGFSPDGRAMFSFAHNWLWYMEAQFGPYRPGNATVESMVVPNLPRNLAQMDLRHLRVAYRGANRTFQLTNPQTGLPLRSDQGSLGLLAMNGRGEVLAGTLMGETLYMPVPNTPGLWSLRLFCGGIAPASSADQANLAAIQTRVVSSFEPSAEFLQVWHQAHDHTMQRMRDYGRQMEQVFERYMSSSRRSNARVGKDPMEDWAEMMREGHYERDARTGEDHWVGSNHRYWWKNDRGELVGNNTGQPPADQQNWHPLSR